MDNTRERQRERGFTCRPVVHRATIYNHPSTRTCHDEQSPLSLPHLVTLGNRIANEFIAVYHEGFVGEHLLLSSCSTAARKGETVSKDSNALRFPSLITQDCV